MWRSRHHLAIASARKGESFLRQCRTREEIALDHIAAEFTKDIDLFKQLGAFSDDRHAKTATEGNDALEELT